MIARKNHIVAETIDAQEPDGYIGMLAAPARMWKLWDVHEMGYIIFGLTSDYRCFGRQRSLAAARKAADYIVEHWGQMPAKWRRQLPAVNMYATGLEGAMLALYGQTGDQRYLEFCTRQRALADWNPGIAVGPREGTEGHVYAYLTRCLAQLDLYHLQPDEKLLRATRRAMHFLTAEDGMVITGTGGGQREYFTDDQDGRGMLGENCATTYQLRIWDALLRMEGDLRYGDLMERTIYNHLFASQSPDGRQIRYYTSLEGRRWYYPHDNYCCPANFRRIMADLPAMVYYRSGKAVAVNLYTASAATIALEGGASLRIRQETDYPTSGRVVVRLDPSQAARFSLQLRIPRWCGNAVATVNGQPWEKPPAPGSTLTIDRRWNAGDRVTLDMPMTWRLVLGRKRQSGRAAVMRGPSVFCLDPDQNPELRGRDAADLGKLILDPASLKESTGGETVRPGGVACAVRAWDGGFADEPTGNLPLRLTEFPDAQGKCVYFRLPNLSAAVPDELISGNCR